MALISWYCWKRWQMIRWTENYSPQDKAILFLSIVNNNICSCTDYELIKEDLRRILL